jgi:hypothetical protein
MTMFDKTAHRTPSMADDSRTAAIRILLALAEVDPAISGATPVKPDGSVAHLDAATLRRGGQA